MFQIDCAEQGFDPVGQDARLVGATGVLLALAQQQVGPQAVVGEMPTDVRQRLGVDDAGSQLGQITFGTLRMPVVELLGDRQAEHRVPEELQAFVGGQPAVLVGEAAMRERHGEQLVRQIDTQRFEQRRAVDRHVSSPGCSRRVASLAHRGSICS